MAFLAEQGVCEAKTYEGLRIYFFISFYFILFYFIFYLFLFFYFLKGISSLQAVIAGLAVCVSPKGLGVCGIWSDPERGAFPYMAFNPIQTRGGGGGGLWRPVPTLQLNNFKTVKTMTTKFSDFS